MKTGRPPLPAGELSKWGAWKRGQRHLPQKPNHIRHHLKPGTYGPPTTKNTTLIPRSNHAAIHNRLRAKRRGSKTP